MWTFSACKVELASSSCCERSIEHCKTGCSRDSGELVASLSAKEAIVELDLCRAQEWWGALAWSLTLDLDVSSDDVCLVKGLANNVVPIWEGGCAADGTPSLKTLQIHDRVLAVNDRRGTSHDLALYLKQLIEQGAKIRLSIQHPVHIHVFVNKDEARRMIGARLGMGGDASVGLVILEIQPGGLIDTWNQHNPKMSVAPLDRIIRVENCTSLKNTGSLSHQSQTPDLMFELIGQCDELMLTILHFE